MPVVILPVLTLAQLALANDVWQWTIDWPRLLSMSVPSGLPAFTPFVSLQRFFMNDLLAAATKA